MNRTPRKKELEYQATLRVLSQTKFFRFAHTNGLTGKAGFADVIHSKAVLKDALAFIHDGSLSVLLMQELIGPVLLAELPGESVKASEQSEVFTQTVMALNDTEVSESTSYANEDIVFELVTLFQSKRSSIKQTVTEKLQITKAVLPTIEEKFDRVLDFVFLSRQLTQTASTTHVLYCNSQDTFDPVHDLTEHFLQQQMRLRSKPTSNRRHLSVLPLDFVQEEELLELHDRTIGLLERKFTAEQRLQTEALRLPLDVAADTTKQDVLSWMKSLALSAVLPFAPKHTYDPLLGRFFRFLERERNVQVFGARKFPLRFNFQNSSESLPLSEYEGEVVTLKRKLSSGALASSEKRRFTSKS